MSKISTHILNIISSYTTNEITEKQFNDLQEWLNESSENKRMFSNYLHFYKKSRRISFVENFDKDKAWSDIIIKLEKPLNVENNKSFSKVIRLKSISRFLKYAAMIVIILGLGYFFKDNIFSNNVEPTPTIVNTNTIEVGTDKAVLTLDDGSQIALEKGNNIQTRNATSNGKELVYKNKDKQVVELVFNHLTVPRGGQFVIELSDGTKVWLNSESQLKYPVNFIKGQPREVELVYGEAYFDVSPSSEHKGTKFKVFNQFQEIDVLGTEFNIKAYKDESNVYTTLVEGKIGISIDNKNLSLIPNQQLNLDINTNASIIKTVDVYNEVSWKDGVFSFENKTLEEMMKVLSRWYDIEIVFKNESIKNEEFAGILRKNKNLEIILKSIKNFGIIKNFEISDEKVVLE